MRSTANPWVKLARTVTCPHGTEPAGAVGIRVGPAKQLREGQIVDLPGYAEVHLVHVSGGVARITRTLEGGAVAIEQPYRGGDTRQVVAIREEDLVLVTERTDVPADRLATYHPEWQPRAARTAAALAVARAPVEPKASA